MPVALGALGAVAGGVGLSAVMAAPAYAAGGAQPSPAQWAALRQCESSGDYAVDTGNGYYGAYQFLPATWQWLGFSGLPSAAAPSVQDAAAALLYQKEGWSPWPACSAKLGFSTSDPTTAPAGITTAAYVAGPALADADADADAATMRTYQVVAGDTLWHISLAEGSTVAAIAAANHLADPNLIYPGQVLQIP